MTAHNARFWIWLNGDHVKITLRPGQCLNWSQFTQEDEGWNTIHNAWELSRDGLAIMFEWYCDGADCDGRLSRGGDMIASADPFTFETFGTDSDYMRPDWQDGDQYRRDYRAEAANY